MNKKIKRGTALLTSAVLLLGAMPMDTVSLLCPVLSASAEETAASGTCGDKLTWTLDSEGTLTISGTGKMKDYTPGKSPFYGISAKKAVIEEGVTSIGNDAFNSCTSLTAITMPDSVTSIGDSTFFDCKSLTSITIPDSVTSIGDSVFSDCKNLTSIHIPNSVTKIGDYAIQKCTSLTTINIPDNVTSIGIYAFSGCTSLTSITIPDSVNHIGDFAFSGCSGLTSITIPDGASIGSGAFSDCTSLTSITIPDSVIIIGNDAFDGTPWMKAKQAENPLVVINGILYDGTACEGDISIPDGVTSIDYEAFYKCTSLTSITIPDSVTNIGSYAFSGCTNLTSITIPDSVTSLGSYAFSGCKKLTILGYPDSYAQSYAEKNNIPFELIDTEQKTGDITGDGEISIEDAQLTLNAYVDIMADKESPLTAEQVKAADVNGDNVVSVEDAQFILMYYVQNTVADKPTTWEEVLNQET